MYLVSLIFWIATTTDLFSVIQTEPKATAWWNHACQHTASVCDLGSLNKYNLEGARERERERGPGKWKKVHKKERGCIRHVYGQEFLLIQNWVLRIPVELLTRPEVTAHSLRVSSCLKANAVYHQLNLHSRYWWISALWFMADSSPFNQSSHIYSHPTFSLNQFQTVRALMVQFSIDLCQIHTAFSIFQLVHII